MSSTGDIIRKKMRPRTPEAAPGLAWWQAHGDRMLREIFKRMLDLDVTTSDLVGRKQSCEEALGGLGQVMLPFLLQTKDGQSGLFVVDGALIDGLIEQQLLGKVMPTPRLDRPITAIDAGLSEGFVRAVLKGIARASEEFSDLATRGPEQDRPTLELALGGADFDILSATVDLGPGIKTGMFEIWTPAANKKEKAAGGGSINPALMDTLKHCKVELLTEMSGCEITAKTLLGLQVGSVLSFPATSLADIALKDCNGRLVGRGRLGQLNGQRALRMVEMEIGGNKAALPSTGFDDLTVRAATAPAMTDLSLGSPMGEPMAAAPMGQAMDQQMGNGMGGDLPAVDPAPMPAMDPAPMSGMDPAPMADLEPAPMPAMDAAPMQPLGGMPGEDEDAPMSPLGIDPAQAVG